MIEPMLCETGTLKDLKRQGYVVEEKYDGTMGFISKNDRSVKIQNRHGVDYTSRLPDLVDATKQVKGNFTMQGEIVYINPDGEVEFTPCQQRCATQDFAKRYMLMNVKQYLLHFYAWSLLEVNGTSLENEKYVDQKETLRKLLPEGNRIRFTPHRPDISSFFEEVKARQGEGVIIKREDGYYVHERSYQWLKIKNWRREVCNVAGFTPGKNSRSGLWGSLVLADQNGKFRGKAGSGPNDWELRRIKDILTDSPEIPHPFKIAEPYTAVKTSLKVLIKYYKTTRTGVMRFPVFEKVVS